MQIDKALVVMNFGMMSFEVSLYTETVLVKIKIRKFIKA